MNTLDGFTVSLQVHIYKQLLTRSLISEKHDPTSMNTKIFTIEDYGQQEQLSLRSLISKDNETALRKIKTGHCGRMRTAAVHQRQYLAYSHVSIWVWNIRKILTHTYNNYHLESLN